MANPRVWLLALLVVAGSVNAVLVPDSNPDWVGFTNTEETDHFIGYYAAGDYEIIQQFNVSTGVKICNLSVHFIGIQDGAGMTHFDMAIWSGNATSPVTLIDRVGNSAATTTGWNNVSFSTPVSVSSGTPYWIWIRPYNPAGNPIPTGTKIGLTSSTTNGYVIMPIGSAWYPQPSNYNMSVAYLTCGTLTNNLSVSIDAPANTTYYYTNLTANSSFNGGNNTYTANCSRYLNGVLFNSSIESNATQFYDNLTLAYGANNYSVNCSNWTTGQTSVTNVNFTRFYANTLTINLPVSTNYSSSTFNLSSSVVFTNNGTTQNCSRYLNGALIAQSLELSDVAFSDWLALPFGTSNFTVNCSNTTNGQYNWTSVLFDRSYGGSVVITSPTNGTSQATNISVNYTYTSVGGSAANCSIWLNNSLVNYTMVSAGTSVVYGLNTSYGEFNVTTSCVDILGATSNYSIWYYSAVFNFTSGCSPVVLSFLFWDEQNRTSINSSMDATFTLMFGASNVTVSSNWSNQHQIDICMIPAIGSAEVYSHQEYKFLPTYPYRFYALMNASVSNATPIIQNLYSLHFSSAYLFVGSLRSNGNLPLAGRTLKFTRYYPATNEWLVVAMAQTDGDGKFSVWLEPNSVYYAIAIYDGLVLEDYITAAPLACDPAGSYCSLTLREGTGEWSEYLATVNSTSYACVYNNATLNLSCVYSHSSGLDSNNFSLKLVQRGVLSDTVVCWDSSSASTSILTCHLPDLNHSYYYLFTATYCCSNPFINILDSGVLDFLTKVDFGATGLFATLMLVLAGAFILGFQPQLMIVGGFLGLLLASFLGLFAMKGADGGDVTFFYLAGLGLIGAVILFKMRRN